jgi:hypothetical protein
MPTCREKLLDEHPELIGDIDPHNCQICPNEYGYAPKPEYCDDQTMTDEEACKMCWEREVEVPKFNKTARRVPVKTVEEIAEKMAECGNGYPIPAADVRKILDSGTRREFETGAVRDIQEGKGRCDLLPLDVIGEYMEDTILANIQDFKMCGSTSFLYKVLEEAPFMLKFGCFCGMCLEVSKHFEEGAKKYGENNWQKGIPVHCYIDSAVRHYLKFLRGDMDEPHDRAFVWNIMCAIWTCKNKPELNEYLKEGSGDV